MINLDNKKVFIAPHTPKTTMLEKVLLKKFKNIQILGFLDKTKKAKGIYKPKDLANEIYDYILIFSPNHFDSIYKDYSSITSKKKLLKVDVVKEKYVIYDYSFIKILRYKNLLNELKINFVKLFIKLIFKPNNKIVFISKSFIGNNNKALFIYCYKNALDVTLLTDNCEQLKVLKKNSLPSYRLTSIKAYWLLISARFIIQDQGNSNDLLKHLNKDQTTIQLWHGLPLKRMNKLVGVNYDYHISTSKFINESSLGNIIQASNHLDYGYSRNDLLLKEHNNLDLLLIDNKVYNLAKKNKVIVYMPTHRESSPSFDDIKRDLLPIDFKKLNEFLLEHKIFFILKLHPFLNDLYESLLESEGFSNILIHNYQADIYPTLKYTDILITDYSSVYYDFLFVNKPIIFFEYDKEEYEENIGGFQYDYEKFTPGVKVRVQDDLQLEIKNIIDGNDDFNLRREELKQKLYEFYDENTSKRICTNLLK